MSLVSVFAIYFVLWWLVFFAVLPFGVRSHHEGREVTMGQEHGAPDVPMLGRKIVITSLIAALITGGVYVAFAVYGFTLEDLIL